MTAMTPAEVEHFMGPVRAILDEARAEPVYGMCMHCGSVEVQLVNGVAGYRDLSAIGEHERYPVGYGCEVCS